MKKLFMIVCLIFCLSTQVYAIDNWYVANEKTIEWTAPASLVNGDPIPTDNVIEYAIYISTDKSDPIEVAITSETSYTIAFDIEGDWLIGVEAIRKVNDQVVSKSQIAWSDMAEYCENGVTFGVRYYVPVEEVKRLKVK